MDNDKMRSSKIRLIVFSIFVIIIGVSAFFIFKGKDKDKDNLNGNAISDNVSISTTNLTISKGSVNTFEIGLVNAVGRIDISSSDGNVATVDNDVIWLESLDNSTEDKQTISVKGMQSGSAQITIVLSDVVTFDTEQELTGSMTVNVTVE